MPPTEVKLDHGVSDRVDPVEVRRVLSQILASPAFRSSKRSHDFLEYVVTKTLAGDTDNLKERTLAVEVFGRKADADLGEDSIVRVGAREVRKRLAQYYVTEGAGEPLHIDLLAGSYVPTWQYRSGVVPDSSGAGSPAVTEPGPPQTIQPKRRRLIWFISAAAAAVVLIAALTLMWWRLSHRTPEEFESFWRPALAQQSPLIIALAHPIVYHPSTRITRLNDEKNAPQSVLAQRPINLPPEEVNGSDYIPVYDQYVGFGVTVAVSRLSALFAERRRTVRVRLASKLEYADIRDSATVLIGAFTNRWTMEVAQQLRYRFAMSNGKPCILDAVTGETWTLTDKLDNGRSSEDYILICRLTHATTGSFVIVGAGLTQHGTEEAGRILADPGALAPILRKAPASWRNRNLELLLHSQIVGDSPAPSELIVSHVW